MKITYRQLRQIIREQIEQSLPEPSGTETTKELEIKSERSTDATEYYVVGTPEDCKEWSRNLIRSYPRGLFATVAKKLQTNSDGTESWFGYRRNSSTLRRI